MLIGLCRCLLGLCRCQADCVGVTRTAQVLIGLCRCSQGDHTLGGGRSGYDVASCCLVCGVVSLDGGHRTFRRGVKLFDVASNFSMWRRNVRSGTSKCSWGGTPLLHEGRAPAFPHRRIRYGEPPALCCNPPRPSPQNHVWAGFTFSLGTSNLRLQLYQLRCRRRRWRRTRRTPGRR